MHEAGDKADSGEVARQCFVEEFKVELGWDYSGQSTVNGIICMCLNLNFNKELPFYVYKKYCWLEWKLSEGRHLALCPSVDSTCPAQG